MKRIMIIGNSGTGKSTLAKKVQQVTGLPLIHLDREYWSPGWVKTPDDIWQTRVQGLVAKDEWIIDGSFGSTLEIRMQRADTIVLLENSALKSLFRVIKRNIQYMGKSRPDMTEGCIEKLDLDFLHYIITYNMLRRARDHRLMDKYADGRNIYILRNEKDANHLLQELTSLQN